jgi:hypothetical protein
MHDFTGGSVVVIVLLQQAFAGYPFELLWHLARLSL